jgi:hypothetical protein
MQSRVAIIRSTMDIPSLPATVLPLDPPPVLSIQDIPATLRGPTGTRTVRVAVQSVPVIIGQFLTVLNIPQGNNPDMPPEMSEAQFGSQE